METLQTLLQYAVVRGALSGIAAAALIDFAAFRTWKQWSDAQSYDWKLASWRWFQGAIVGALTGIGFAATE